MGRKRQTLFGVSSRVCSETNRPGFDAVFREMATWWPLTPPGFVVKPTSPSEGHGLVFNYTSKHMKLIYVSFLGCRADRGLARCSRNKQQVRPLISEGRTESMTLLGIETSHTLAMASHGLKPTGRSLLKAAHHFAQHF